ncbi:type II secretion system F family protein [Blautia schinkii]|nr:type II secretion system F family protein [Blautia schinkii]
MKKKNIKQKNIKQKNIKQKNVKQNKKKYIPQKPLFGEADDYYIYTQSKIERLAGGLVGFLAGAFVFMVFFRSVPAAVIAGVAMVVPGNRKYKEFLKEKRLKSLRIQFRDMMESLSASYSAGKNTEAAFQDAAVDMENIYGEKADIVKELRWIVSGLYNGQNIEDMLLNFGRRSHMDDIESFATVFEVCIRYGGDMKKVVGDTRQIICDKIETEMEIQTLLTANKNELNIMAVMPVIIMLMLSSMGNLSIVQNTPANVLVKCGALVLFVLAYVMGRKIVDIKV